MEAPQTSTTKIMKVGQSGKDSAQVAVVPLIKYRVGVH